ncbi:hypothetical protein BDW22DRAFT_908849 [Trametopsis cervina]|nr:hypothetical protein BDW22DRAFT_908849 [Trametopsis cervina]
MSTSTTRKRKGNRPAGSLSKLKPPSEEQRTLAKKSVRDHFAIVAVALLITLGAYCYRTYFAQEDAVFVQPHVPPFAIVDIPGKGKGMVARRDIQRGELILKEKPLFILPSQITHTSPGAYILHLLAALTPDQQASFYDLSYVNMPQNVVLGTPEYNDELALAIVQTNAVAAAGGTGIFPRMARLNHACSSAFNSVYSYREDENAIMVYALKAIKRGEASADASARYILADGCPQELLTTYKDTKRPRNERRSLLQENYGFTCQCRVCSLPDDESQRSDGRLARMVELQSRLRHWGDAQISGSEAIGLINDIWATGEEEGYHSERGALAADGAVIAAAHSDVPAVREWTRLAHWWYSVELGADSQSVRDMEGIVAHPEKHPWWRTRASESVGRPKFPASAE